MDVTTHSMPHEPASSSHGWPVWAPLLVLALTLGVRGGVWVAADEQLWSDSDGYQALAHNVLNHGVLGFGGQPSAYRPPLYPLTLAAASMVLPERIPPAMVVNLIAGVLTVLATAAWAGRLGLGRLAWAAAALVACDPLLVQQSTLVMTETLAAMLAVWALLALARGDESLGWRIAAGLSLGLACLTRPTFLLFLAVAPLALVPRAPRLQDAFWRACVVVGFAGVVLAPWAIRNARVFGRAILGTTHGGFTLWLANNPEYYAHLRARGGEPWNSARFNQNVLAERAARPWDTEVEHDRREASLAVRDALADPAGLGRATLWRQLRFWGLSPQPREGSVGRRTVWACRAWYAPLFALAALGLFRSIAERDRRWLGPMLLCACFAAAHLVYWTDMRMRAPLMPAIAVAATRGVAVLVERRGGWRVTSAAAARS